ncbi:hypothetical protein NPIL_286071, partial [Nephila pilipes]
ASSWPPSRSSTWTSSW